MATQKISRADFGGSPGFSSTGGRLIEYWGTGLSRGPAIGIARLNASGAGSTFLYPSTGYNNSATTNVLDLEGFKNVALFVNANPSTGASRTEILMRGSHASNGTFYAETRLSTVGATVYSVDDNMAIYGSAAGTKLITLRNIGARYVDFRARTPGGSQGRLSIVIQAFQGANRQ